MYPRPKLLVGLGVRVRGWGGGGEDCFSGGCRSKSRGCPERLRSYCGGRKDRFSSKCHLSPINPRSEKSGGCGWGCTVCPLSVTRGGLVGKAQAIPWITHISAIHTFHPGILFLRENRKQGNKLPARRRSPDHYFIRVKTTNNVTI